MHKVWPGRRAYYKNINNSDLDGMSLASFCQSRAELSNCENNYDVMSVINFVLFIGCMGVKDT